MTTFGIDASEFQRGLSLTRAHRQGYRFGYFKATEGQGYRDPTFHDFIAEAEEIGMLDAAYHFLRSDSAPEAQAENFLSALPDPSIPCVVDVEESKTSKPGLPHFTGFFRHLRRNHYHAEISMYYPQWWWQRTGSRTLPNMPHLFSSNYGENTAGGRETYPGNSSARWTGYGGKDPVILQFTSRGRVRGFKDAVDLNAFRGGVDALARLGIFRDNRKEGTSEPVQHSAEPHPLAHRVHVLEGKVANLEKEVKRNG